VTPHSARARNKNYSNLSEFCRVPTQCGDFNVRGSATAFRTAVGELLSSQVRFIQLVSLLERACNLIYFNCLKIELTKNLNLVLIVLGWYQFMHIMLCDSERPLF
jgi:hypothetical protein